MMPGYVAQTLLSWSHIVSETCPTLVSNTRVMCIFKYLLGVHMSCSFPCCNVRAT